MNKLPTKEENPNGLHQRYNVTKADGSPTDPNAVYFVLRIDTETNGPMNSSDFLHRIACREAALKYIKTIKDTATREHPLYKVADQLADLLVKL